ncbi:serine/threonine-protein kinase [Rosistilla oblonga]|uniref:serine/threonine-protein kinase n=1 Tax=Rosistilla oblonga TaxID=2527990 RepID=UPI003A980308
MKELQAAAYEESLDRGGSQVGHPFEEIYPETAQTIRLLKEAFAEPLADAEQNSVDLPASIGRFQVQELIGQGGMGVVYRAIDPDGQGPVAIKVSRCDATIDRRVRRRIAREAIAASTLDHPGIVPVVEVGSSPETGHAIYLVMDWCEAGDLGKWMRYQSKSIDCCTVAAIGTQVAQAAEHAHRNGIVHRDLKPANILLFPKHDTSAKTGLPWTLRITDFGVSHLGDQEFSDTSSGLIVGTPLYMAPEQAMNLSSATEPCVDIFAIGAILYHLLTGEAPFAADSYPGVLLRLQQGQPDPVSSIRPDVDKDLEAVCMKCLQAEPANRYRSAAELAADLNRYLDGVSITLRPVS